MERKLNWDLPVLLCSCISTCMGIGFTSWSRLPDWGGLTFDCLITGLCLTLYHFLWPWFWPGIAAFHPDSLLASSLLTASKTWFMAHLPLQSRWPLPCHPSCMPF